MTDRVRYARALKLGSARTALVLAAIAVLPPRPTSGQIVRGRVVEAVTDKAVPGATVRLRENGESVSMAIAGASGGFILTAPRAAEYTLEVEHIGYALFTLGPVQLGADQASDMVLRLTMQVIPITPINVEVDARVPKLERAGFYDRRRLGIGTFLERRQIEDHRSRTAADVLRRVSGLRLVVQGYFTDVQARGSSGCRPGFYIDGALVSGPRRTVTSFNLEDLPAPDLEAIEVYPGAAGVPPQYNGGGNSLCGLILFWTRHPGT